MEKRVFAVVLPLAVVLFFILAIRQAQPDSPLLPAAEVTVKPAPPPIQVYGSPVVEAQLNELERPRRELWRALRSRALSDEELVEVARYGASLNVEPTMPYQAGEKLQELTNALLIQQMSRAEATRLETMA